MKTARSYIFTEPGCYGDGTFGHAHIREMLAAYLQMTPANALRDRLMAELKAEPSDDYSEEYDALVMLDDSTDPTLYWHLEDGELFVSPRVEEE